MENKPIITSKFSATLKIGLAISIAILGLIIYLYYLAFAESKPDFGFFIIASFLGAIILIPLYRLFTRDKIDVYKDYFILKKVFRYRSEKVFFSEITHWAEKFIETKNGGYRTLRLYTNSKEINISQEEYKNYKQLKQYLTQGKPNTSKQRQKKYKQNQFTILVVFASVFVTLFWLGWAYAISQPPNTINKQETTLINDVLSGKPDINNIAKGGSYIILPLKSYPKYEFRIDGLTRSAIAKEVFPSDSIHIRVETNAFEEIKKEIADTSSFWRKSTPFIILVYSVKSSNYTYQSIEDYNQFANQDNKLTVYFVFIPILLTILAVVSIAKQRKKLKALITK